MPLITPPNYKDIPPNAPLVFLIGPIQGTSDWQSPAAWWLLDRLPNLFVASPRSKMWREDLPCTEKDRLYKVQTHWEHTYIREVMNRVIDPPKGVARAAIVAFCAKEEVHDPSRAFAQTTRYEIGKILGWINGRLGRDIFLNSDRLELPDGVFIGAHPDYFGRRYLENDLISEGRQLYSTIEEVCGKTFEYLHGK